MPILDELRDSCNSTLPWIVPCTLIIAVVWFVVLGEIRVLAAQAALYIKETIYKPHVQKPFRSFWKDWPNRLGLSAVFVILCYYYTVLVWTPSVSEDQDGEVGEVGETGGVQKADFMISQRLIQAIAYKSEQIVWIMGTILHMPRQRFLPFYLASKCIKPLANGVAIHSGNFALWLALGWAFSKLFRLTPKKEPYIGTMSVFLTVLSSAMLLTTIDRISSAEATTKSKRTRVEVSVAITLFCLYECLFRYVMMQIRMKQKMIKKFLGIKSDKVDSKKDDGDGIRQSDNVSPPTWRTKLWNRFASAEKRPSKVDLEISRPTRLMWYCLFAFWMSTGVAIDGV